MDTLQIYSIFYSIQGESLFAGLPCVFIRLAGCSANCNFCDTREAITAEGEKQSIADILEIVQGFGVNLVEVTGGEPLEQKNSTKLLKALADDGYRVLLETNGVQNIEPVDSRIEIIMDIKTPGFGSQQQFLEENISFIATKRVQIKFVITSKSDFDFAVEKILKYDLHKKCPVLISPIDTLNRDLVAKWILSKKIPVRLQLQLHKIIWPNANQER